MKKLVLISALLIFASNGWTAEAPMKVFEGRFIIVDGIIYDQNTNEPITGIIISSYYSSTKSSNRPAASST